MLMFPLWLLKFLIYASLALCAFGIVLLLVFLFTDSKGKRIW